ncbi:CHAP domain-containing protein [Niastella caeni]|uniref:CHAP domain-containing protein n=1 Tax=Niastella caeni TaxID=2569763 RepID=A0A4S8HNF6_9BACT|nr:CHAP domain-containing protein [Niastella caeni]THU36908.1 CHAP domain-containing protein [Niastella caeni]
MTNSAKALEIAISQLGVREKGSSNSGVEVDQYLKSVGLNPGYPWCMAFVYWCYQQAAKSTGVSNFLIRTGGVLHQWNEQQPKRKIVLDKVLKNPAIIQPGAVFIMDYGKGTGHTGLVERIQGGLVETIEGNTNDEGSREGYEVCRRTRKLASIKGFIQ